MRKLIVIVLFLFSHPLFSHENTGEYCVDYREINEQDTVFLSCLDSVDELNNTSIKVLDNDYFSKIENYGYSPHFNDFLRSGFKKERDGLGMGGFIFAGKDLWIGGELSLYRFFESSDKPDHAIDSSLLSTFFINESYSAFTLGYSRSIKSAMNDFAVSLLEINSVIDVIPMKFGIQYNIFLKDPRFYYRPSIGFGIGPLSISYAYNLMFSKMHRPVAEKHLLFIKLTFVPEGLK